MRTRRAALAVILSLVASGATTLPAVEKEKSGEIEEEIWALEEAYIAAHRDARHDDVISMLHTDFLGWPRRQEKPREKADVAGFLQETSPRALERNVEIEREGIRVSGDVVITHYMLKIESSGSIRLTHTWIKEGLEWKILGGMSSTQEAESLNDPVANTPPAGKDALDPLAVESGYVEVEGGRIFYEVTGRGPALVMIHDGLLHRETWDSQFGVFAKTYRVIRWDRRGYGRSDAPQAPFSNREDLLAVMKTLKVDRATLMGCSYGGLLAMEFALEYPEMVFSLALVGPIVAGFDFSEHFRTRGGREMPGHDAPVAQRIEYWSSTDPWIVAPGNEAAKERIKWLFAANPQNLSGSSRYARPPDQPTIARLSHIKVPTLIVVGESDIPDVHTHIGVIQADIDGSKRVVLANSGHLCHMEVPEKFNEAVLRFLGAIN